RAVGQAQLDDLVRRRDRRAVDELDGDDGQRAPVHAVDEIADAQFGDRPRARWRGDRRRRRRARTATDAALRARPVHRIEAADESGADLDGAAELSGSTARVAAAERPGLAIDGRAARRRAARAVAAIRI